MREEELEEKEEEEGCENGIEHIVVRTESCKYTNKTNKHTHRIDRKTLVRISSI